MALPFPLAMALESAINLSLSLDQETRSRLRLIDGKTVRLQITQTPIDVLLAFVDGRINLIQHDDKAADTTLRGSLTAFRSLAAGRNDALYRGEMLIDGDVALAQQLKGLLAGLSPDWQELVSPILGDALTHRLDRSGQAFSQWLRRAHEAGRRNTSEYLQEELELIAPESEVQRFCNEVDELRDATERLAARIRRLPFDQDEIQDGSA